MDLGLHFGMNFHVVCECPRLDFEWLLEPFWYRVWSNVHSFRPLILLPHLPVLVTTLLGSAAQGGSLKQTDPLLVWEYQEAFILYGIPRSSFGIPRSSFGTPRSIFGISRSIFGILRLLEYQEHTKNHFWNTKKL